MQVGFTANDLRILQGMQQRDAAEPRVSYDPDDDPAASYTPADLWVQLTNTTLAAAVASTGSHSVAVADGTGIFVGGKYTIGGTAEVVQVTAVTKTAGVVTSFTATFADTHLTGATVQAAINAAGRWPGVLYSRDGYTPATAEMSPIWLQSINGTVPTLGKFIRVCVSGFDDVTGNTLCDMVEGASGASGLNIYDDGTLVLQNVPGIDFQDAGGLNWAISSSGGNAEVQLQGGITGYVSGYNVSGSPLSFVLNFNPDGPSYSGAGNVNISWAGFVGSPGLTFHAYGSTVGASGTITAAQIAAGTVTVVNGLITAL
jgi:hypothetical protein